MRILRTKKRIAALSLTATAVITLGAIQAEALVLNVPVRGKATQCLAPEAERVLAAQKVQMESIGSASVSGSCLTYTGTGTVSPKLTGGKIPIDGGMRFANAGHRLEITNMTVNIKLGTGYTSADVSQDGAPRTNITLFSFPVSLSDVTFTPTTVETKGVPVSLAKAGDQAFTKAFGNDVAAAGSPLFIFRARGEITSPLANITGP
ncbi:HtaA domain-containing protein [Streptomyces hundungensis]|uniref:HtaA domain-containing protein n=1 Tax=Streptomyces hundungensis TaxID=1077946 RepID=UPI0033E0E6CB